MTAASQAALVFSDDFDEASPTALAGKAPDLGSGTWTGSSFQVAGGALATTSGTGGAYGTFTTALSADNTLTLQFSTLDFVFSNDWGGVSLYSGGGERIFVGDGGGVAANTFWGVFGPGSTIVGGGNTGDTTAATTATLTYEYDSGAWTFSTSSGGALSGTAPSGLALNQVRIERGGATNFTLDNLSVDISPTIPEPSAALLSFLGFGAVLRRRR